MSATAAADVLATIVAAARRSVEVRRQEVPRDVLERAARAWTPRGAAMRQALAGPGVNVIAECKRRSPSKGILRAQYDPVAIAAAYGAAGATAISVLTEPAFFDGAPEHLQAVRRSSNAFLLRKDFIVDEYQLAEAHAWGADAVLLIVAALDDSTLRALHDAATARGFAVLVEVHTAVELERAQAAGATLIGVNSRNLKTLAVSIDTTLELASLIRSEAVAVAESGIRGRADMDRLRAAGYDAFLIGERLMTQEDPGAALAGLLRGDG
ncbi:MAG TPA: indole-3-glycerol phosphate synthase TrpC [Vicinamibacterales bacterium]